MSPHHPPSVRPSPFRHKLFILLVLCMCDWRTTCPVIPLFPRESRDWTHRADAMVSTEFYYWMIKIVKWQRRDDEWKSCTGHSVLWCPSPFVRSTTSQSQRTNERVEYVYSTKHSTPTTSGPWLHKELSSLVYIFIYLNFPHLTTFYFPLTSAQQPSLCRPLLNSPSFSYSARPPQHPLCFTCTFHFCVPDDSYICIRYARK